MRKSVAPFLFAISVLLAPASGASAQERPAGESAADTVTGDTLPVPEYELEPLVVEVTRSDQELAHVPLPVSLVGEREIQFARRQVTPVEALQGIPGVFVQNRHNFSLSGGVRLNLRSPPRFGMRGLQLIQDGVPLTMADGTTQPTNLEMGSAGRIQVIRGPSSVLYGNAAGGVISVQTEIPSDRPLLVTPEVQIGEYGYDRQQVKAEGSHAGLGYVANFSRMTTDGFRRHSEAELRRMNLVVRASASEETEVTGVFNLFHMPFGQNSSSLTLEDARQSPRSTRDLAYDQGWGETATQGQGGVTVEHDFGGGHALSTTGWGMWRNVWNPIPFRIIDVGRVGAGARSEYRGEGELGSWTAEWVTGVDVSYQSDDRNEFGNAGVPPGGDETEEGDLRVDQQERVLSTGPFAQLTVSPRPEWHLTAGVRYDYFDFDATDRFLADGDQSGGRTLDAVSPTAGVTWEPVGWINVYANFATAYETPTTVELSNRPSGEGGFNRDLEPEDLRSVEVGLRGRISPWKLRYEVAGYRATLENAFVAFEGADEQTFFRNTGESSRDGIELLLEWRPVPRVRTRLTYTYQDFVFERFQVGDDDFAGNREPGAPPHQLFAEVTHQSAFGLLSSVSLRWVDAYPVNNENTVSNWAYTVVDLRFGLDRRWSGQQFRPFFGVDNVFDGRYNASTWPNAFGDRYFEPGPDRAFYAGLSVELGR